MVRPSRFPDTVSRNFRKRGARLIYWLPLIQIGLGTLHIPGPALIAPAFAFLLAQKLARETGPARGDVLKPA